METRFQKLVRLGVSQALSQMKPLTHVLVNALKTTGDWTQTEAVFSSAHLDFLQTIPHPSAYKSVLPTILMLIHSLACVPVPVHENSLLPWPQIPSSGEPAKHYVQQVISQTPWIKNASLNALKGTFRKLSTTLAHKSVPKTNSETQSTKNVNLSVLLKKICLEIDSPKNV